MADRYRRGYGRNHYNYRHNGDEEPLPYSAAFRVRLMLCAAVFLFFAFSGKKIITDEDRAVMYDLLEEPASWENVKHYRDLVINLVREAEEQMP